MRRAVTSLAVLAFGAPALAAPGGAAPDASTTRAVETHPAAATPAPPSATAAGTSPAETSTHGPTTATDGAPAATSTDGAPPEGAASEAPARLPDPGTWRQSPAPVRERPAPYPTPPRTDVGLDAGLAGRVATGTGVHVPAGFAMGGHVRVDLFRFLAARVTGRTEVSEVAFADGALGLPPGTRVTMPALHRVYFGLSLEPTWSPLPVLDLWVGVGLGWGRSTTATLHATGAETAVVPSRGSVFLDYPLSVGLRYHVVPRWLVVNLSGSAALLASQTGSLLEPYRTPGAAGTLVTVGAFPRLSPSWTVLAGIGVLL